jgi:hypothetical protein
MGENGGSVRPHTVGFHTDVKTPLHPHPFSLPIPNILCQTSRMRNLTATLCLTVAVLIGSAGVSASAVN